MVDEIKWPKRYRSRPVACTLCKSPTYEQKAICRECTRAWEFGKNALSKQESNEKFWHYFYKYARLELSAAFDERASVTLRQLLEHLTGEFALADSDTSRVEEAFNTDRYLTNELKRNESGRIIWGFTPGPFSKILLTEAQGQLVKKFWAILQEKNEQKFREGQRDGSSFLRKLAEGNVTTDQINHWTQNSEKD